MDDDRSVIETRRVADSATVSRLLNSLIARAPLSPADVDAARALCEVTGAQPRETHLLALAIGVIHESRDRFDGLKDLNARLCALSAAAPTLPAPKQTGDDANWDLLLTHGVTLAALHNDAATSDIRNSAGCAVASVRANAETSNPSLQLLALTSALHACQATDLVQLRIEIDALAQRATDALPPDSAAAAHWWVERTLMEVFLFGLRPNADGRLDEFIARSEQALVLCNDRVCEFKHARSLFELSRLRNDFPAQSESLDRMQAAHAKLGGGRRALGLRLLRVQALAASTSGNAALAEQYARAALALASELHALDNELMALWSLLVSVLMPQAGRVRDAAEAARNGERYATAQHRQLMTVVAELLECRQYWEVDRALALERLARGLALAREINLTKWLTANPALAGWIAARAIEHGIEPDFCKALVVERGLPPPPDAPRDWPWKLRIQLLGGYSLEHDGTVEPVARTSEQRPHDVIQALAIAGPAGLTRAGLARALYGRSPPRDNTATNMALSRARKLVGDPSLIESDGQRTRLNPREVYVDLWALGALAETPESDPQTRCERALALYSGPLLDGFADHARHRLAIATARDRFVAVIESTLPALAPDAAKTILIRAIQGEPAEERLYRLLIENLLSAGEIGQAKEMLERYKIAMTETRGEPPSPHFLRAMTAAINAA